MKKLLFGLALVALLVASIFQPGPAIALDLAVDGVIRLQAGTATATSNAATLANKAGKITSEALTTAGLASYTVTITNTVVAATDLCFAAVANGTNTVGTPDIGTVTPGAGSLVIVVRNNHATEALNGTLVITFNCFKA